MPRLILPEYLRDRLKLPLGTLLTGQPEETIAQLKQLIEQKQPPMIICVGDFVSKNLKAAQIVVDVNVVDNKIMRESTELWEETSRTIFRASNPPGTLDPMAWEALHEAIQKKNSVLIIDGEEDLLALPAILLAPDESIIVYGQPREGLVVVRTSPENRAEIHRIIDSMSPE